MIDQNKVEWRSCKVVDCPHYMVSSEGEVINKLTNYKMNPGVNRNRYVMICIRDIEGKRRVFNLGRLVLMVFKPHPLQDEKGMIEADHIDGNTQNNKLSNLRWLTKEENRSIHHNSKKRNKHKWGIAVVRYGISETYDMFPEKIEIYARQADVDMSQSVISTLLTYGHLSKKYRCRIYYKDQIPEEFQDLPVKVMSQKKNSRDRKISCYNKEGDCMKIYDTITSVQEDGFNKYKCYNAAREKKMYRGLYWRFTDEIFKDQS